MKNLEDVAAATLPSGARRFFHTIADGPSALGGDLDLVVASEQHTDSQVGLAFSGGRCHLSALVSRPSSPASGATVPGRAALQMPSGDPAVLRARAMGLRSVETAVSKTPLLRGTMAQRLPDVWSGAAADAAVAESAELVRRAKRVTEALPEAAKTLPRCASALELARVGWPDYNGSGTTRARRTRRPWRPRSRRRSSIRRPRRLSCCPPTTMRQCGHDCRASTTSGWPSYALPRPRQRGWSKPRASAPFPAMTHRPVRPCSTGSSPAWRSPGVAGAARSRQAALGDAAALKKALASGSSGAAAPSPLALSGLMASVSGRVDDPVYAQVMVDELGVGGIQQLVAELARSGSSAASIGRGQLQEVTGLLGQLLLTATTPVTTDLDPRAERLVTMTSGVSTAPRSTRSGARRSPRSSTTRTSPVTPCTCCSPKPAVTRSSGSSG